MGSNPDYLLKSFLLYYIYTGGLMSESFSIFQKMCQINILNILTKREEIQDSGLVQFLEDGNKVTNLLR